MWVFCMKLTKIISSGFLFGLLLCSGAANFSLQAMDQNYPKIHPDISRLVQLQYKAFKKPYRKYDANEKIINSVGNSVMRLLTVGGLTGLAVQVLPLAMPKTKILKNSSIDTLVSIGFIVALGSVPLAILTTLARCSAHALNHYCVKPKMSQDDLNTYNKQYISIYNHITLNHIKEREFDYNPALTEQDGQLLYYTYDKTKKLAQKRNLTINEQIVYEVKLAASKLRQCVNNGNKTPIKEYRTLGKKTYKDIINRENQ